MHKRELSWTHVVALLFLTPFVLAALIYFVSGAIEKWKAYPETQRIRNELIAQEIYEIDMHYIDVQSKEIVFYMVCEPPKDGHELNAMIKDFMTEERIAELRVRAKEDVSALGEGYLLDGLWIQFIEPSADLDIGFFPEPGEHLDEEWKGHQIASVSLNMTDSGVFNVRLEGRYESQDKRTRHT